MVGGPACDNGKQWQLCKDVCKKATCTKNPDAKCVSPMGGCGEDACQPKFYDSMGKQVQCEYNFEILSQIISM